MSRRLVKIDNDEIKSLLLRKMEIINDNKKLSDDYQELEKKINKNNTEIQKVKDKAIPLIEAELEKMQGGLGEFEMFVQSEIDENGDAVMVVIDQVEEMKEFVKKNKEAGRKNVQDALSNTMSEPDSSKGNGEGGTDNPTI